MAEIYYYAGRPVFGGPKNLRRASMWHGHTVRYGGGAHFQVEKDAILPRTYYTKVGVWVDRVLIANFDVDKNGDIVMPLQYASIGKLNIKDLDQKFVDQVLDEFYYSFDPPEGALAALKNYIAKKGLV